MNTLTAYEPSEPLAERQGTSLIDSSAASARDDHGPVQITAASDVNFVTRPQTSASPSSQMLGNHSRWQMTLVAIVVLLHIAVGGWLSARLNLWQDEAFTLYSTSEGPLEAVKLAVTFELQPPLYFLLLDLWRYASDSLFWARMFSVAATAGAIVFTALLARRWAPQIPPVWIAAVAATNPVVLWAASEARCYALVILLSAALLWLFELGYRSDDTSNRRTRVAFLCVATAGLYTQYYLGFLLVACGACLVVERRWPAVKQYLFGMFVVAIAFAPLAGFVAGQVQAHAPLDARDQVRGFAGGWIEVYRRAQDCLMPLDSHAAGYDTLVAIRDWAFRAFVVVTLGLAIFSRKRGNVIAIGVVLAIAGCFFAALRAKLGPDFFVPRYTVSLIVPLLLALVAVLAVTRRQAIAAVVASVLILANVTTAYSEFTPPVKTGDWSRVAEYLASREAPGEPIVLFINECELPLEFYYGGTNRLVPLPKPFNAVGYSPADAAIVDQAQVATVLEGSVAPGNSFWLVTCHEQPFQGFDKHVELLRSYLDTHADVLDATSFRGTKVEHYRLRTKNE